LEADNSDHQAALERSANNVVRRPRNSHCYFRSIEPAFFFVVRGESARITAKAVESKPLKGSRIGCG
jgi:hypothetical protein